MARAPAPLVSTYAYLTPLVGAVMGATVLDEQFWAGAFVGAALVLGAVALELRGRARADRPRLSRRSIRDRWRR
jgi:drug/metabolite transporter (DMT)-like permease